MRVLTDLDGNFISVVYDDTAPVVTSKHIALDVEDSVAKSLTYRHKYVAGVWVEGPIPEPSEMPTNFEMIPQPRPR